MQGRRRQKIKDDLSIRKPVYKSYWFVKYGFGRATDHANIDIRNKRITREEGLELVKKYDGKYPHFGVNSFVEYSGMSKIEVDEIIDNFTNPILFKQNEDGSFARDEEYNLIRNFKVT